MRQINTVGVDSAFGFRTIDVIQGDITAISEPHDLLVVSAFSEAYLPIPGTLLGSLSINLGFSLEDEAERPRLDLREALSIWISREIKGQFFKRVLCVEILGADFQLEDVFENLFAGIALLEAKGTKTTSMVLPVLGTGNQGLSPRKVMEHLLPQAIKALEKSPHLTRICFVEQNKDRAEKLDRAVNKLLGREEISLTDANLLDQLKKEILEYSRKAFVLSEKHGLFNEIKRVFGRPKPRSFEVGVLARRLVEFAVNDLIPQRRQSLDLCEKIESLKNLKIAAWIASYMHSLRIFGNESVHDKKRQRTPKNLSEKDFVICLFCMGRVLDFWIESKSSK